MLKMASPVASASSGDGEVSSNELTERDRNRADICDKILSTHRSMPDKTVSFHSGQLARIGYNRQKR